MLSVLLELSNLTLWRRSGPQFLATGQRVRSGQRGEKVPTQRYSSTLGGPRDVTTSWLRRSQGRALSHWPTLETTKKSLANEVKEAAQGVRASVFSAWGHTCSLRRKPHPARPARSSRRRLPATRARRQRARPGPARPPRRGAGSSRPGGLARGPAAAGRCQDPPGRHRTAARPAPAAGAAPALPPGVRVAPQSAGARKEPRSPRDFSRAGGAGPGRRAPRPRPARAGCRIRPASSAARADPLPPAPLSRAAALVAGGAASLAWEAAGAGPGPAESAPRAPSAPGATGRGSDVCGSRSSFESVPG